ncbi:MAG: hypothetical protein HYT88_07350 [Candidatus Omnitrophica bacterium]|nr:hypothetical protein [Candidatus Omnitrophota bacterium]
MQVQCDALKTRIEDLEMNLKEISQQRDEANWYLAEAKSGESHVILEQQLALAQAALENTRSKSEELEGKLEEATRGKDEANWYLGELRVTKEELAKQLEIETAQRQQFQAQLAKLELEALQKGQRLVEWKRAPR